MDTSIQAPSWLNPALYPFKHRYVQLQAGAMHYVDEGQGEVILFVHGTPTWSFLFRNFIRELSQDYRCVAIDHLGFGLSEKPDFVGTPAAHAENLTEFVNRLSLKTITLVVHDFGGPIGLCYAAEHPDNVKRIVLFNTWLWETKNDPAAQKADKIINSLLGRFLYLRMNFSPKVLLKKGFSEKNKLTKLIHKHYLKPFPDKSSRRSLLHLAKSLVGSSHWYEQQWKKLDVLREKPQLILWGTKDEFITTKYLNKWKTRWPKAIVDEFDCGHFVPEEQTKEAITALKGFVDR